MTIERERRDPTGDERHGPEPASSPRALGAAAGLLANRRHRALHVVLAGGGDLLLQFQAAASSPRVHFPGPILHGDLPDLYRAADLFVLPAVHDPRGNVDGLPNVILEAMASSLPVVATSISGIPLAVVPGETGLLVPESDPAALFRALSEFLANPEQARSMGERGRLRTETELTSDAVAARYRDVYLAPLSSPLR